ncbi:MAG: hypothetical protein V1850_04580 [Candidatus Bathyarchaeota archaeon]
MLLLHKPIKFLTNYEKEQLQKSGYMCEHLLCFNSMSSGRTALYGNNFPVYFSDHGEVDAILFGFKDKKANKLACVQELLNLPIKELNIVTPEALTDLAGIETRYIDWDYQINIKRFDINLKGREYKNIRYSSHRADKMRYCVKFGRELTPSHIYIMSRHMARHTLDIWDIEELLSLEHFFREHRHGFMMEAYFEDELVGFDVIDFFEENRIMVVPLGIYLESPSLPDFLMHENIKYAKENGCEWLDVGLTCGNTGLKSFKEKWFAEPKHELFVQKIRNQKYGVEL